MRQAFELAFTSAYKFNDGRRPIFRSLDDTHFLRPVEIGSFLQFDSKVIYSRGEHIHVQVIASVLQPGKQGQQGELLPTNTFTFLLECPQSTKQVVPRTYGDTLDFLTGRRYHFELDKAQDRHNLA